MGYNKFRWFTNGKRKKPLPKSSPLLLRIRNGDFEYSPYFDEAKKERARGEKIYDEYMKTNLISDYTERKKEALQRSKMKRVKALKLEAVGDEEENKRLIALKEALTKEFGKDLWDKAMERQRGKGTTEDFYWWYKNDCSIFNRQSLSKVCK